VLLRHEPDLAIVQGQQRLWDLDGAGSTWLAAALLVPRDAAARDRKIWQDGARSRRGIRGLSPANEWRLNETGARIRANVPALDADLRPA